MSPEMGLEMCSFRVGLMTALMGTDEDPLLAGEKRFGCRRAHAAAAGHNGT